MNWKEIWTPSDLQQSYENMFFEAKEQYNLGDRNTAREELAKDVAAFATALGGVILIGAKTKSDRLSGFRSVENPAAVNTLLRDALELCTPRPSLRDVVLELTGSKQQELLEGPSQTGTAKLIALNIAPSSTGPIGVRRARDTEGKYWSFPCRTGAHVKFLDAGELMIMLNAHERMVGLLLERAYADKDSAGMMAPADTEANLPVANRRGGRKITVYDHSYATGQLPSTRALIGVDFTAGVAIFGEGGSDQTSPARVPLSFVRAVWKDIDQGWSTAIDGRLFVKSQWTGGRTVAFMPLAYPL